MKGRLFLVLVLMPSLLSILPVVSRTGTKNLADTFTLSQNNATEPPKDTTDSQAAEGQNLPTHLASNNDTTENTPEITQKPKAYDCSNASLAQPLPILTASPEPENLPPERIRPPGLFPVFYDGAGARAH